MSDQGEFEFRSCEERVGSDCYFRQALLENGASPTADRELVSFCQQVAATLRLQECIGYDCPVLAIAEDAHDLQERLVEEGLAQNA